MAPETIVVDLASYKFTFFRSRRPSRPLPRTSRIHLYCTPFRRNTVVQYHNLPAELWNSIHDHLPVHGLQSLALVNRHIGAFARNRLGRRVRSMKATGAVFRSFFSSHSMLSGATSFKIRSITLRLSPYPNHEVPSSNDVLAHWLRVSRDLNHLCELAFLGTDVRYDGPRDVLKSIPPTARLRQFYCEDDNLLDDCLESLCGRRETLEDFGGFFDTKAAAPRITPDDFLMWFNNVRTLEVSVRFVNGLRHAGGVTHLSVRLEWQTMVPDARCLSKVFGAQVRALRLERKAVDRGWTYDGDNWVRGPESPLFLCASLDMPALRYLEVRDSARRKAEIAPPDAAALGHPGWATFSDYDGVVNLDRLAWRPTWAADGAKRRKCADAFSRAAGDVLPVLTVWMSLGENASGIWDTWTRFDEDLPLERQCLWDAVNEDSWKRMA